MRMLVLEDDRDRRVAMLGRVAERFPFVRVDFYETASEIIAAFEADSLADVALIALDHDLEFVRGLGGNLVDPGDGRDVANWLAEHGEPSCPVVVHTTNTQAGDQMMATLGEAGWGATRVVPHGDLAWIDSDWFPAVRNAIVDSVGRYTSAAAS